MAEWRGAGEHDELAGMVQVLMYGLHYVVQAGILHGLCDASMNVLLACMHMCDEWCACR